MTATTYHLYGARGMHLSSGDDRAALLSYLGICRRPRASGVRKLSLHVLRPGQLAIRLDVELHGDGQVTVTSVQSYRALLNVPLHVALREVCALAPPVFEAETSTTASGRSVWLRLRDPWPPVAETPTTTEPTPDTFATD